VCHWRSASESKQVYLNEIISSNAFNVRRKATEVINCDQTHKCDDRCGYSIRQNALGDFLLELTLLPRNPRFGNLVALDRLMALILAYSGTLAAPVAHDTPVHWPRRASGTRVLKCATGMLTIIWNGLRKSNEPNQATQRRLLRP
jgi:hypothetical protein